MKRLVLHTFDKKLLAITATVLLITIILCSFEDVYFSRLSVGEENKFDSFELFMIRQSGNVFSIACCVIALILAFKSIEERDLKRDVEYLQYSIRQSERQYKISRDTIDLINVKCHDIKYTINSALGKGGFSAGEAETLGKSVAIYDTRTETGNDLLDVLFTEKSLYCEQHGITFSCMADGSKLKFMSDGDLLCLFGNIVDNALDAVRKLSDRDKRVINLVVKEKAEFVTVQADNYFDGTLRFADGLPVTTKADKNYHGFGMRSIKMIAEKYDGTLTAFAENGIFHLNILFPIQHKDD